jgi:hypothetical protein
MVPAGFISRKGRKVKQRAAGLRRGFMPAYRLLNRTYPISFFDSSDLSVGLRKPASSLAEPRRSPRSPANETHSISADGRGSSVFSVVKQRAAPGTAALCLTLRTLREIKPLSHDTILSQNPNGVGPVDRLVLQKRLGQCLERRTMANHDLARLTVKPLQQRVHGSIHPRLRVA